MFRYISHLRDTDTDTDEPQQFFYLVFTHFKLLIDIHIILK